MLPTTRLRRVVLSAVLAVAVAVPAVAGALPEAASPLEVELPSGPSATVEDGTATLSNGLISRTFTLDGFTSALTDLRTGVATEPQADFALELAGAAALTGDQFNVTGHEITPTDNGGLALTFTLTTTLPGHVTRTYTIYPDTTVIEVDTDLAIPGSYTGYTLDAVGAPGGTATAHHFNAGYDWRGSDTPDWSPTVSPFGGEHTGDHRVTTTGDTLDVTGQWLSVDTGTGTVFQVLQRVNYDSSHVAYDGQTALAHVDLADDLIYLGPFEADLHLDNPAPAPVRSRDVLPGQTLPLERVVTGLATDTDDEAWQHFRYLRDHAWNGWQPRVTFNSNGVDSNRISTGAKDDMDMAETIRQADVARQLGVETFILDDGWQAASGDWCPDSPDCPEPRTGKFPDRFPDAEFTAVRDAIAPMDLGLWMSPMHFNPGSDTYGEHPEWACSPLGDGLALYTAMQPDTSSNEAGLGTWNAGNPDLIAHIEQRITRAIETYGSTYFKFDFLAWIDCVGAGDDASMYEYREAFVAMLDRLIAAHPGVTFQIDETNDYRLFPFESASRGPSWFANGNPTPDQSLHNLWVLSPFVPAQTLGQSTLGRHRDHDADYLMAIALTSHLTFFNDLTSYSPEAVETTRRWVDLYTANRERFTGVVYPLLDDPLGGQTWTALQSWDHDTQSGALMAYRQQDPDPTTTIALRGIADGDYEVTDAMTGELVRTSTADELRTGIDVTLDHTDTAAVWFVHPA